MAWKFLWSIASHHSEPADPALLHWIKDFLDSVFVIGPWLVVVLLGALIAAIPLAIMGFYLLQQKRSANVEEPGPTGGGSPPA